MTYQFFRHTPHHFMRNILLIFAVFIFCSGCSTIVMHSGNDPLVQGQGEGIYSGVRLDSAMLADRTNDGMKDPRPMVVGYSIVDLPFSTLADTICLPVDLFHKPHEVQAGPKLASGTK